jgi:hypothetical protein
MLVNRHGQAVMATVATIPTNQYSMIFGDGNKGTRLNYPLLVVLLLLSLDWATSPKP